jgi:hypothetical protein
VRTASSMPPPAGIVVHVDANDCLGVHSNGYSSDSQIKCRQPNTGLPFLSSCKNSVCMQPNQLHTTWPKAYFLLAMSTLTLPH